VPAMQHRPWRRPLGAAPPPRPTEQALVTRPAVLGWVVWCLLLLVCLLVWGSVLLGAVALW